VVSALHRYLAVLRLPRAAQTFTAALVGHLSFAMVGLTLLFAARSATGSLSLGGAAIGTFGAANVIAAPYRARFVDRRGQRLALRLLGSGYALALTAAAILCTGHAPRLALIAAALSAGLAAPPLGPAARGQWARITDTAELRARAYSLAAVGEEAMFTVGPPLAGAVMALSHATIALLLVAATGALACYALTVRSADVPTPLRASRTRPRSPLRAPQFRSVLVAIAGVGAVLGTTEVVVPAVAVRHGSTALAGVLLGAISLGSGIGGLAYGQRTWRLTPMMRLVLHCGAMALICCLLGLATNPALLAAALGLLGLFLAPAMVTGYLLGDELTSESVRTEASTWINTALNGGSALAAGLSGVLTAGTSPTLTFAAAGAVGAASAAVAARRVPGPARSVSTARSTAQGVDAGPPTP
jgi:MFS family permease